MLITNVFLSILYSPTAVWTAHEALCNGLGSSSYTPGNSLQNYCLIHLFKNVVTIFLCSIKREKNESTVFDSQQENHISKNERFASEIH